MPLLPSQKRSRMAEQTKVQLFASSQSMPQRRQMMLSKRLQTDGSEKIGKLDNRIDVTALGRGF